jgi:hypothetical protein
MEEWRLTVDTDDQLAELRALLGGVELQVGSKERGDERTETIARVESAGVGFDVYCMFGFVKVICGSGVTLLLYTDGAVHDHNDVPIGRHDLILTSADGRQSLAKKR